MCIRDRCGPGAWPCPIPSWSRTRACRRRGARPTPACYPVRRPAGRWSTGGTSAHRAPCPEASGTHRPTGPRSERRPARGHGPPTGPAWPRTPAWGTARHGRRRLTVHYVDGRWDASMSNEWGPLGPLEGEWEAEGGLDTAYSHAAVSYTHLTLPTKRIV